jgi:hypothetical protein
MLHGIKKELEAALQSLSDDPSLGYLAVTAKPELPVRDRVAWYFHQKRPELITAREYYIKKGSKQRRRVDLALLKGSGGPVALVEFKAMHAPDALGSKAGPRLVKSLVDDLEEVGQLWGDRPLGVMLMVHIQGVQHLERRVLDSRAIKYLREYLRQTSDADPLEQAIENARYLFNQANFEATHLRAHLGSVWGAWVQLVSLLVEPQGD